MISSFVYLLLMEIFSFFVVEAKHCVYMYESGYKYFQCSSFEYCCGPLCCRNRSSGFFQLWYFWLLIFLMMMLCSGGGWWYKFRYRTRYRATLPNIQTTTTTTPFIYGTGPSMTPAQPVYPMPYNQPPVSPMPYNQPPVSPMPYNPPPVSPLPYPIQPQNISEPPPPYCGPPPSYNMAMANFGGGK